MSSELETVNDIIDQEIRDASEAASHVVSMDERSPLEQAYWTAIPDRTGEQWKLLYFDAICQRDMVEIELSQVRSKWGSVSRELERVKTWMSGIKVNSEALDVYLTAAINATKGDQTVRFALAVAKDLLREVSLRVVTVNTADCRDNDIPF